MQRHQPLGDRVRVDSHVAHGDSARANVLIPDVIPGQVRHRLASALSDGCGDARGAELAQFLPAVEYFGPVVAGFYLVDAQGQDHKNTSTKMAPARSR